MTQWIKVGGVWLPPPTKYKVLLSDLDSENSSRNEKGKLKRDRIRSKIYKIEASWTVPVAKINQLVTAFNPESFSVNFYDITSGDYITRTMYAGDKSAEVLLQKRNSFETLCRFDCNLIEL